MVKVAPVLQRAHESGLPHTVWLSGQHTDSIQDLINDFGLRSEIVRPYSSTEKSTVARLIRWLPRALLACYRYVRSAAVRESCRPLVIVHGDTISTLASALAGRLAGGDIVHLESGLSSGNLFDPFPEEILRRLTFRLTRYAVCPNPHASKRMCRYRCEQIVDTGENTLLDCVRYALRTVDDAVDVDRSPYFIASIHRFQNIYRQSSLSGIVQEIVAVSRIGTVYFILHPATRRRLARYGLTRVLADAPDVRLKPRMPYTKFVSLLAHARGVLSDGGSNQEELSYLGVPTVLFRRRSERPDGLGRNVVLRCEIDQPMAEFVNSGALDRLRAPRQLHMSVQPALRSIEALRQWATDPLPDAGA